MAKQFREARKQKNLKAIDAAKLLGVSQPTLSTWEWERKSPSVDALEKMADLYGVSTDYLLGRPDHLSPAPTQPITLQQLRIMNGKPVWSPVHGWMLVNASSRLLLLADGTNISFADVGALYVAPQPYAVSCIPLNPPLEKDQITQYSEVWLEPISQDACLREDLRGWYKVIGDYVENQNGNRFSLCSYGAKWLAFATNNNGTVLKT